MDSGVGRRTVSDREDGAMVVGVSGAIQGRGVKCRLSSGGMYSPSSPPTGLEASVKAFSDPSSGVAP
jgi:hypothetical protein